MQRRTRRPLEGGTLLADFLGNNLLTRTRTLERRAEDTDTAMLSAIAAGSAFARPRGALLFSGWGQENVAANQSAVTLARYGLAWQAPLILPFAGSVTALLVSLNSQQTAGSLTVTLYIAGSSTGLAAVIDGDNRLTIEETAQVGEYAFEAGEQITLRITTTSGWAPTTAEMMAMVEVAGA